MTDKTHYRKAFNSPYLGSADIVGPTILTINHVRLEADRTNKTKDSFNTAHFSERELRDGEPLKPMILNAHNSKVMRDLFKSAFIDDWNDIQVTIYVDPNVKFGRETVEGLRIRSAPAPDPVSVEQLAAVQEFRDAGEINEPTLKWLDAHELTSVSAERLLEKLRAA